MATIQFEDIIPWGQTNGDTGLSSRLKLKRNFDKIKAWADALDLTDYLTKEEAADTYLTRAYFDKLFHLHVEGQTAIVPSDTPAADITGNAYNIEAMFGFWTEQYISSLGMNNGGGGGSGGGVVLTQPLLGINNANIGTPSAAGTAIVWNGTNYAWGNPEPAAHVHDNRYYTKTEVDSLFIANAYSHPTGGANTAIAAATGKVLSSITVNSLGHVTAVGSKTLAAADIPNLAASKITSGTFDVARIPSLTKSKISDFPTTWPWTAVTGKPTTLSGYGITDAATSSQLTAATDRVGVLEGYFDASGAAKSAAKLTTVSKKAWGQTYWTSGGVPTDISGNMTGVGRITLSRSSHSDDACIFLDNDGINIHSDGTNFALYVYGGDTYIEGNLNIFGFLIEEENARLKFNGDVYATGAVSALGLSAQGSSGGALSLLTDVDISTPADGQVLTYDALTGKWVAEDTQPTDMSGYLPLSGGNMTGSAYMVSNLSAGNYPSITGNAIGMLAKLNQHTGTDDGLRGGVFFMYTRNSGVSQDRLNGVIINCLSEYKSDWYNGNYGLKITSDALTWKGSAVATQEYVGGSINTAIDNYANTVSNTYATRTQLDSYLPLTAGSGKKLTGALYVDEIDATNGYGLLAYKPDWGGFSNNWMLGTTDVQGVIRSSNSDLIHRRGSTNYTILDTSNMGSHVLPLTAGSSYPLTGNLYVAPGAGTHQTVEIDGSLYKIGLAIGSGNTNRGLYGHTIGGSDKWLLYFNANDTILNYGSVGIGTTTPSYKLDVSGSARFSGDSNNYGIILANNKAVSFTNSGGTHVRAFYLNDQNYLSLGWNTAIAGYNTGIYGNTLVFGTGTSAEERARISNSGNVGIGTTSPSEKLHVAGNILATGAVSALGMSAAGSGGPGLFSVLTCDYLQCDINVELSESSTIYFGGTQGDDPAIYMRNGHIYARAGGGNTVQLV